MTQEYLELDVGFTVPKKLNFADAYKHMKRHKK